VWGWQDAKHGWPLTESQFHEMLDPSHDPGDYEEMET
jgi:hypothetical protein